MDGDGSIYYRKIKNRKSCFAVRVNFASCLSFLEPLKTKLKQELGISLYINNARAKVNSLCRDSSTKGKYDSIKLLNWLYKDATFFLKRKYDIYQEILRNEKVNLEKRNSPE